MGWFPEPSSHECNTSWGHSLPNAGRSEAERWLCLLACVFWLMETLLWNHYGKEFSVRLFYLVVFSVDHWLCTSVRMLESYWHVAIWLSNFGEAWRPGSQQRGGSMFYRLWIHCVFSGKGRWIRCMLAHEEDNKCFSNILTEGVCWNAKENGFEGTTVRAVDVVLHQGESLAIHYTDCDCGSDTCCSSLAMVYCPLFFRLLKVRKSQNSKTSVYSWHCAYWQPFLSFLVPKIQTGAYQEVCPIREKVRTCMQDHIKFVM